MCFSKDHPRVCGENLFNQILHRACVGSPPRVRGKRARDNWAYWRLRITPACAGKTHARLEVLIIRWDHPRVCGENSSRPASMSALIGSPPRVRGKRADFIQGNLRPRITPACAGKTSVHHFEGALGKDHPRVCGENMYFSNSEESGVRITPACAGKTLRKWRISVVDPSPQPRSSLTSRRADASIGSQRAPCAAPV